MQRRDRRGDAHGPEGGRPTQRLRETGRAYVEFALAEPGLFGSPSPPSRTRDDRRTPGGHLGARTPTTCSTGSSTSCVEAGSVARGRRPGADVVCWAAVHGFATLHLDGPLQGLPAEERTTTLEVMLDHISRGLS